MMSELLREALESRPPRGDAHLPHISDTVCDLQRWAERSGEPMASRTFESLLKMQTGLWWEQSALDFIEPLLLRQFDRIYRGLIIAFDPFAHKVRFLDDETVTLEPNELIGHPDLVGLKDDEATVVEVKTTAYLGKEPMKDHWIEQTMNYATALGAPRGIVVATDFKRLVEREYATADYEAWSIMRMKEILRNTDPEAFPPAAAPRQSWACGYCDWLGCALNPKAPKEDV